MKKIFTAAGLCLLYLYSSQLLAKQIQILHTNDLHSYLDHSHHEKNRGGYGRIKTLIDKYRQEAKSKGIETIVLDAGDFMEGNLYYMADAGRKTMLLHDKLGFTAVVMGNHDYLMGTRELESILLDTDPKFAFLSGNLKIPEQFVALKKRLRPYTEFVVDGVKVGIFGVTTNSMVYTWRFDEGGKVLNPVTYGKKYAKELKKRGNDLVIGLTHIGLSKDKKLARTAKKYLDIIVGGHSHHALHEAAYEKDIPIVQAGEHGQWLGVVVLDIVPGKKARVVSQKLVSTVNNGKIEQIDNLVEKAKDDLATLYGKSQLSEVIGFSNLEKDPNRENHKVWAQFISDTTRKAVNADIGVHVLEMGGPNYPIGPISRETLYNSYPRIFDFDDYKGYSIYTAKIRGTWLYLLFKVVMSWGLPISFSGVTFDYKEKDNGNYKISNIRINGKKLKLFKLYDVAMMEAMVRGGFSITKCVGLILKQSMQTNVLIWDALEDRISDLFVVEKDYFSLGQKGTFVPRRNMPEDAAIKCTDACFSEEGIDQIAL